MKRFLTISLLLFVAIAFTFSVFSADYEPPNNVDAIWRYELVFPNGYTFGSVSFPFGSSFYGIFSFASEGTLDHIGVSTDLFLTIDTRVLDTLYICFPESLVSYIDFTYVNPYIGNIFDFYDSDGDLSFVVPSSNLMLYTADVSRLSGINRSIPVHAFCFRDVVPDFYTFPIFGLPVESIGSYPLSLIFYFGVFGVKGTNFERVDDIMSDYSSGSISYSDAVSGLVRTAQSVSPTDGISSLIEIEKLSLSLEELKADQFVTSTLPAVSSFESSSSAVVDAFRAGSVSTFSTSLSSLSSSFSSALSASSSPEEAQLITAQYNVALNRLSLEASWKSRQSLDGVISGADFAFTDDYYEMEDQMLSEFDQAQFESLLAYNDWLSSMDVQEASLYREFFNFFLEDSELKNFIVVPMVLSLVSILLGTSLRYSKGHGSGKGSGKS